MKTPEEIEKAEEGKEGLYKMTISFIEDDYKIEVHRDNPADFDKWLSKHDVTRKGIRKIKKVSYESNQSCRGYKITIKKT
tara:strand:+ start:379 stop:618 length:240 start_codon:yes stop_codon:yes gene_type:complete